MLYRHIHSDNDRNSYFLKAFQFPWKNSWPPSCNICRATYRCWRGAWSMWQRMSSVFHPPMNEIGSRAGEDRTSPNVHGDAHHVVRGNGCRRGCRCSHLSSTSLRFEIGCCAAGGVNLSFGVVGVSGSSVKGTRGSGGGEWLADLKSWTTVSEIWTTFRKNLYFWWDLLHWNWTLCCKSQSWQC